MTILALSVAWFLFGLALLMGTTAWLVFLWSVRTGQFEDTEGTAQRMLEIELDDRRPAGSGTDEA